jgi:hypothetical protein
MWKRFAGLAALAALTLIGVACGPLPQLPVASFTSPYHGNLGGGGQVPGYPPSNTITFSGCASSPGTISVALVAGSDGINPPVINPDDTFTVTISEPGGSETQAGMIDGETLTSPHSVKPGDCFNVSLTATLTQATNEGCDDPFEPDCLPGSFTTVWAGTDYTVTW